MITLVELVRHAEAERREGWRGRPDAARPLTERGRRQAEALADGLLQAGGVDALYASPTERCTASLQHLVVATGLPVVTERALAEVTTVPLSDGGNAWVAAAWLAGQAFRFLEDAVRAHPGGRVVVCSHGDVLPALLALLAGRDGLALDDVRLDKGAWVTLRFDGGRCVLAARPGTRGVA